MADEPVFSFDELVATAVKVLTIMGLSPGEQVQALGGSGPFNGTKDDVHGYIMGMNHRIVYSRCQYLFTIANILAQLFGNKHAELLRWMRVKHPNFGGESMHSLMTSGRPSDLDRALELARDAAR